MEVPARPNEEKISLDLDMASVPEATLRPVNAGKPKPVQKRAPFPFSLANIFHQSLLALLICGLSAACYYGISNYCLQTVEVVGSSMVPTLHEKGHYFLNKMAFRNREPQRNDVVVIRDPGDHGFSVKRVVAVEGESIWFKNGRVYVDGKKLEEGYLLPGTHTFTYSRVHEQFITCGKGQYFVLGDNRLVSIDSRSYGPVARQDILGLVMLN